MGRDLAGRRQPDPVAVAGDVRQRLPQGAQAVGLAFALVGLVGLLSGLTTLGLVATGFALAAALLNAAFGLCLGCEMYLLLLRLSPRRLAAQR